jgi:hypothetical protein
MNEQDYQLVGKVRGNDITINAGLEHNAAYEITVVPVSHWGARKDPIDGKKQLISLRGKHDPPQAPSYLSGQVVGDYYSLTWSCGESDHKHIELRRGDEWLGSQKVGCFPGNTITLPIDFVGTGKFMARSVNRTDVYSHLITRSTLVYNTSEYNIDSYSERYSDWNGTLSGVYTTYGYLTLYTGGTTGSYIFDLTGMTYERRQVILDLNSAWEAITPQVQHMGFSWDSDYAVNTTLDEITGNSLQGIENVDTYFNTDNDLIPYSGLYPSLNTLEGPLTLQDAASIDVYIATQDNANNWSSYKRYYTPINEYLKGVRVKVLLSSLHNDIRPEVRSLKVLVGKGKGYTLSGLTDVQITSPTNGQALVYSNGNWVNDDVTGGTGSGAPTDLSYLTAVDETADLPRSRYMINDFGIAFDDGGPGAPFSISVDTGALNANYALTGHTHVHSTLTSLTSDDHTQYILKTPLSSTRNIISGNYIGLTIQQVAGQSVDMFRIRNSGNTANHFAVASDGATQYAEGITYIGNDGAIWIGGRNTTYDYAQVLIPGATSTRQLLVGNGLGQYMNLEVFRDPTNAVLNTNRCFRIKGENGATEISLQTADTGLIIRNNVDNSNPLLSLINTGTTVASISTAGKVTSIDADIGYTDPSGYYVSTNGSLTGHLQELGSRITSWWDNSYNVHTMNGGGITYGYTATCPIDAFGHTALGSTTTTLGYKVYDIPSWHNPTGGVAFQVGWFHTGLLAAGANPTAKQWRLRLRLRGLSPEATGTASYLTSTDYNYDFTTDGTVTPSGRFFLTGFTIPYTSNTTKLQIQAARLSAANAGVEFTGRIFVNALRPGSAVTRF